MRHINYIYEVYFYDTLSNEFESISLHSSVSSALNAAKQNAEKRWPATSHELTPGYGITYEDTIECEICCKKCGHPISTKYDTIEIGYAGYFARARDLNED